MPESKRLSDSALVQIVNNHLKKFAPGIPVVVRESVTELGYRENGAKGAFIDGTIYLFRDRIASIADARDTLFHEIIHLGQRRKFEVELSSLQLGAYFGAGDRRGAVCGPVLHQRSKFLKKVAAEVRRLGGILAGYVGHRGPAHFARVCGLFGGPAPERGPKPVDREIMAHAARRKQFSDMLAKLRKKDTVVVSIGLKTTSLYTSLGVRSIP